MLYKMQYGPSDLLDPETYEWNPLNDELKNLLNKNKYVCPSEIRAKNQNDKLVADGEAKKSQDIRKPGEEGDGEVDGTNEDDDDDDDDELQDPGYIFETKMPGILTERQLKEFDIGNVKIEVRGIRAQAKVMKRTIPGM